MAARRAKILLGCFRKGDAEDAETYAKAVVLTLCGYPEFIVLRVTDPRVGMPATSKFLPTIYELRTACEKLMAPVREAERRKAMEAGRPVYDPEDEERKRVAALFKELQASLGSNAVSSAELSKMYIKDIKHPETRAQILEYQENKLADIKAQCEASPVKFGPHLMRWLAESRQGEQS